MVIMSDEYGLRLIYCDKRTEAGENFKNTSLFLGRGAKRGGSTPLVVARDTRLWTGLRTDDLNLRDGILVSHIFLGGHLLVLAVLDLLSRCGCRLGPGLEDLLPELVIRQDHKERPDLAHKLGVDPFQDGLGLGL